jgi:hypothetical protein
VSDRGVEGLPGRWVIAGAGGSVVVEVATPGVGRAQAAPGVVALSSTVPGLVIKAVGRCWQYQPTTDSITSGCAP